MNKLLPAFGLVTIALLLVCGFQKREIANLHKTVTFLEIEKQTLEHSLTDTNNVCDVTDKLLSQYEYQMRELDSHNQQLAKALRRSLNNEQTFTVESILPVDITDALCLRWQNASGRLSNNAAETARHTPAIKGNSPASICGTWRKVTLGELVEWTGALLDHAGKERMDILAIQDWLAKTEAQLTTKK